MPWERLFQEANFYMVSLPLLSPAYPAPTLPDFLESSVAEKVREWAAV